METYKQKRNPTNLLHSRPLEEEEEEKQKKVNVAVEKVVQRLGFACEEAEVLERREWSESGQRVHVDAD